MPMNLRNKDNRRSGTGELRVKMVDGQSAIVSVKCASPLKILTPRPRGRSVSACLGNFGGGLVAGDEIEIEVELETGAHCYLGTQASTKVYRNPGLLPSGQTLRAKLGSQSLLALVPDPVQAFEGSLYRQHQQFHLADDSGLVLVDWLNSGRAECGERWAFARYESRNEIFVNGKRFVLDSLLLDPADGPIDGQYRMGRFNCLALVVLLGAIVGEPAEQILQTFATRPVSRAAPIVSSASPLKGGALVRIAGERVEDVRHEIYGLLDFLPQLLHDDPRARKW